MTTAGLNYAGQAIVQSALEKIVAKNTTPHRAPLPKGKGVGSTTSIHVGPVIAYPIDKLRTWTLTSQSAAYAQTTDRGYDIEAMRLNSVRRALAMAFANGVLSTGMDPSSDSKMPFFVTGVGIDWSLAGTTAQSRLTRDFYPHNFTQATFVIQGISLNQQEYGEMVEFIHQAQHDALNGGNLIQLNIFDLNPNPGQPGPLDGGRPAMKHGTPARGVRTTSQVIGDLNHPNQIIRGHHAPITCQGYVNGMKRKHQKGVFVPTWQFNFTVAVMLEGPYKEELHNLVKQKNWTDMLKDVSLFQTAWYEQNNQAALDWVLRQTPSLFDVTQQAAAASGINTPTLGGITSTSGLTVKGSTATSSQTSKANILLNAAKTNKAPDLAQVAVMIAGIWESALGQDNGWNSTNPTYGGLLAGNTSNFSSLGSADSNAVAQAEAQCFFQGGKGYNSANSHASSYSNAVDLAQFVEGCGNQYRQERDYPGDPAAIAEAASWVSTFKGK